MVLFSSKYQVLHLLCEDFDWKTGKNEGIVWFNDLNRCKIERIYQKAFEIE